MSKENLELRKIENMTKLKCTDQTGQNWQIH